VAQSGYNYTQWWQCLGDKKTPENRLFQTQFIKHVDEVAMFAFCAADFLVFFVTEALPLQRITRLFTVLKIAINIHVFSQLCVCVVLRVITPTILAGVKRSFTSVCLSVCLFVCTIELKRLKLQSPNLPQ